MSAKVAVIIPHYNDLARLDACLNSLMKQSFGRDNFEIVVADNASPCGAAAVEAVIAGRATLTICHEKGAGLARNAGVAASRQPLLAFIDSDCIADPHWLSAGIAALTNGAKNNIGLIGGRMAISVPHPGARTGAEAFEQVFAFDNARYVTKQSFTVTANLFTRRDVFEAVGGFRSAVSEDLDWCHRAVALGYGIAYADDALVTHPARANWAQLKAKWQRLQSESLALAAEQPWGRAHWLVRAWGLPLSIVLHIPQVVRSPALANVGERFRAIATLIRIRLWRFGHAHALMVTQRGAAR